MAIVEKSENTVRGRRTLKLSSPATLEPIGEIEVQTKEDVQAVVDSAHQQQPAWGGLSFEQRGEYMLRALQILLKRQDDFIDVIVREGPKPRMDVIQMEIYSVCDALDYYAKATASFLETKKVVLHGAMASIKEMYIIYKPMGVVGIISPWNGPFVLSIIPAIQALMAGNAVVIKPSSITPMSGKLVEDLFMEAGVPNGVVSVLLGDSETGQALIESGVDKISFTGSVSVGRRIAMACAEQLIPCTLELGGKDPMIVCADADINNAAGGAVSGCLINTGQYCCGTERVYVVDSVADEFIEKVVQRVSGLRQAEDGEFDIGALFTPQQLNIVEDHVTDAVAKGAKVLAGGRRNPDLKGLFYEPTVLVDVDHNMLVMKEETFGPIIPIMRVRDEDEAIRLANDTEFGLGANVWTNEIETGLELAKRIHSGSVNINDMTVTFGVPEAPFGGVKNSGIGRVNGETGLKGYCNVQPVIIDQFGGQITSELYPTTEQKTSELQSMICSMW